MSSDTMEGLGLGEDDGDQDDGGEVEVVRWYP